jgi:cation diffusion facilitator family transporter
METSATDNIRIDNNGSWKQQRTAMRLSLAVGVVMLFGKWYAYSITGSAAILSDAAESVVHVIAVGFATFSLWLSRRPADVSHPYGHEKVSFFSAGVEGALIVLAALTIIYEAIAKWLAGLHLENLGTGTLFVAGAAIINAALGSYIVWQGKKHRSIILIANGKHVLTDSWTSFGVIVGLLLTLWTDWLPFDPLLAIFVAVNILWSGSKLIRQSIGGLMDEGSPELEKEIRAVLEKEVSVRNLEYHELRYRNSGTSLWVEFHLLFPREASLEHAHWMATEIEAALKKSIHQPTRIVTHLEPVESHDSTHRTLKALEH